MLKKNLKQSKKRNKKSNSSLKTFLKNDEEGFFLSEKQWIKEGQFEKIEYFYLINYTPNGIFI